MPVYVDSLTGCIPNTNWRYSKSAHLYTDPGNEEELHRFAESIGLRLSWFQNKKDLPHYDLSPNKWAEAVKQGAVKHTRMQCVKVMWAYRALPGTKRPPNHSENTTFSEDTKKA